MKVTTPPPRYIGLDVVRSIALFCVIAVHFFLNTDFYNEPVIGIPMLIMTIMRSSFMICVPLFMMLTGYLIKNKNIDRYYYSKIIRIIFIYVSASILCALYKKHILQTDISYLGIILNIFSFDNAPYSWYVEMYLGLFLLIPFLNTLFDALETKTQKQGLVTTFVILTVLPSIFNVYCIADLDWWLRPSTQTNYFPFVPDWWQQLYPITYFYLGKYLHEFPLNMSNAKKGLCATFVSLLSGIYNYYRSYPNTFLWGLWQDYPSVLVMVQTILVFSIFTSINYHHFPNYVGKIFAAISKLSLGAYLTSWVMDQIVYSKLNEFIPAMSQKLFFFPIAVCLVLLGSLFLSAIIQLFYTVFQKLLQSLSLTQNMKT